MQFVICTTCWALCQNTFSREHLCLFRSHPTTWVSSGRLSSFSPTWKKAISAFRQRGAEERTSPASARHHQSPLIMKCRKTKETAEHFRRDAQTSAPLQHSDRALCKLKRGCWTWGGGEDFYSVIQFLIRFLSPLSRCIDSLPAAETRWALPTAPTCAPHRCQSVINCFQDRFKVATCSRSCTAERRIMRNRNSCFVH